MAIKLPRLAVNWPSQPEMLRRYWDQVLNYIENIAAFTGSIFAGPGVTFDSGTGEIALDTSSSRNVDHSTVNMIAGNGLTGGGLITSSRTFDVGAGTGLTVTSDSVSIASTGVAAGSYGSASQVSTFSVNSQGQLTSASNVPISIGATAVSGVALTRVDDTNVTLTLGGSPSTSLVAATSLTLGWTGTLAVARGGTGGGTASGTLLDNITGFSSTGHLVRTASGSYSFRTHTGTANQIDVTNGSGVSGNPTYSISASYAGQSSITTLGTITSGVWNGTTIAVANGGTGTTTAFTAGSIVFAGASGVYSQNNANLFWDNTNARLGISTTTPSEKLEVLSTTASFVALKTTNSAGSGKFGVRDTGDAYIEAPSGKEISFWNTSRKMTITSTGNIHGLAGTTGMTDGFFYIPSAAGAPTGVPTAIAGRVPMYYDTTNNNFYIYNGAWKKVLLA